MTLPPSVRADAASALPRDDDPADRVPDDAPPAIGAPSTARDARTTARAVAKRVLLPVYHRVVPRLLAPAMAEISELRHQLAATAERIGAVERRLFDESGDRVDAALLSQRVREVGVNQLLQKAEFADVLRRFEELGMAIAPATGIEGASRRLAEQREQLQSLDRRLRVLDSRLNEAVRSGAALTEGAVTAPGTDPTPPQPGATPLPGFDYVGFERRFRGSPEEILRIQEERYLPLLAGRGPVVDIGCGRGELLSLLAEQGTEGIGVEPEPGMAAEARARGLRIEETDAVTFLRQCQPHSLGAVFSAHVVEHVELDYLLEFIDLAMSRLVPGGLFIAETPNPASLIVLGNSYILDPTHVRPLHPSLMAFLCEAAGYHDVRLTFHSPAESYHLPMLHDGDPVTAKAVNEGFSRLNDVLFGAQEYTLVATTPPAGD